MNIVNSSKGSVFFPESYQVKHFDDISGKLQNLAFLIHKRIVKSYLHNTDVHGHHSGYSSSDLYT